MLVDQASCALEEYNLGVTNIAVLEVGCKPILDMLKTPGGARFWKSRRVGFKPEFREYVDSVLANSSG